MSTKLLLQKTESGLWAPHEEPDIDITKDFKVNQIVQAELIGTKKERSLEQLGTYWRLCKLMSDNSKHKEFATYKHVDWRIRNALQFYDTNFTYVSKNGDVNFKVRSISYKNLDFAEACNFFDRAFQIISDSMGIPLDVLIDKSKKTRRR